MKQKRSFGSVRKPGCSVLDNRYIGLKNCYGLQSVDREFSRITRNVLSALLLAVLLTLGACGETEVVKTDDGGKNDPTRRELQLSFLNKLTLNTNGAKTRAAIATSDEQRIDMLDVYVFGSLTDDGEYTFQEKFSYRADGSNVAGATALEVTNGDGSSAKPTVLLRPKKGLYIKMFCIANQAELTTLDAITDPANPKYVPYTHFVPLIQTNPGSADNTVTMGIPTEADFCKLLSRVIDPANKADSIVPALPMVGSCVAPIDLHSFDLASRLSAGIRLVRTVARFDVLNDAATSRFILESVSMGNGRSVTQLYPLLEQKTADDKLITYPVRDLARMPQVNNNKQLPVLYAYGSPVEDEAYLILKGKYRMNATEVQEVSYNVPFSQVVNGTGSRVAITPNHRYTIAITKTDPQHVDFDLTVADWENGEDLGSYTPDNAFGTIRVEPAGQFDAATKTMKTSLTPGSTFTIEVGNNATPTVSIAYDEEGNDWLEATVTTAPVTRTEWAQNTTCTIKAKTGNFTAYPAATLCLTNTADGTRSEIRVVPSGVKLAQVLPTDATYNSYDANTRTLTLYATEGATATAKVVGSPKLAALTGLPAWLKETHTGGDYLFTLNKSGFPANLETTDATHAVTFTDATDAAVNNQLHIVLKYAGIRKATCTVTNVSGATGNTYTNTLGKERINLKGTNASATTLRFQVPSFRGTTLGQTDYGWFTVTHTAQWSEATPYDVYTLTSKTSQASYPDQSLTFTNKISGGGDFTVNASAGVFLDAVTVTSDNTNNAIYTTNTQTLRFIGLKKEQVASVKVFAPGAVDISKPSWLTVTGAPNTGYIFAFSGSVTDYTATPAVITFSSAADATQKATLNLRLDPATIKVGGVKWANGNLCHLGNGKYALTKLPDDPNATVKEVRGDWFRWGYTLPQSTSNTSSNYISTAWGVTTPSWNSESDLGNYNYYKGITGDAYTKAPSSNPTTTETGDPCKGLGSNWRMPTHNESRLLIYTPGSTALSGSNTFTTRRLFLRNDVKLDTNGNLWNDASTDAAKKQRGVYITKSELRENPSAPANYSSYNASQHLFLPAGGYVDGSSVNHTGYSGSYWSSTPLSGSTTQSWYTPFYDTVFDILPCDRKLAFPVRCVFD